MKKSFGKSFYLRKLIIISLVICLLCSVPISASCKLADNEYYPMWTHLNQMNCSLEITEGGLAIMRGGAYANPSNTNKVVLSIKLQRQVIPGSWSNVVSYKDSGSSFVSIYKKYALRNRGDYRLVVTVVINGSKTHTEMCYDSY